MGRVDIKDDRLDLLDEFLEEQNLSVQPWRIMVVDDDGEVHQATRFALSDVEIMGRSLSLVHAYSGAEAESLLRQMPDIAVILLDVVMEADDSGLCLIDLIRDDLSYKPLRIILRTGQPGLAPEAALVASYDIHDYMLKTDVSRERLLTSLTTAVRTFDQLRQMAQMKHQMLGMMQTVPASLAAKTKASLAAVVVQQLRVLYGVSPIVAVWHKMGDLFNAATIVAADMNHRSWVGCTVSQLSEDSLLRYIDHILSSQPDALFSDAVVFHGDAWRLVIVFQESNFTQNFVAESWQMFQSLMIACANHNLVD
jgi:CheY-like chemotaxis protein